MFSDMDEFDNNEFEDLRKKLEDLSCPFIYEVGSMGIQEMLFKPGQSRMKIFEWLLMSFNSKAYAKFQSLNKSENKTNLSQYLVKVFVDFGYYEEDILAVVQGTASISLQTSFFKSILNAVNCIRHSSRSQTVWSNDTCIEISKCSQIDATIDHSKSNKSDDVEISSLQYSTLIGAIIENEILPNLLEEVPLYIQNLLEKLICTKKESKTKVNLQTYKKFDTVITNQINYIVGMHTQSKIMDVELKNISQTAYPSEETNAKLRFTCNKLSQSSSLYEIIHAQIRPSCKPQKVDLSELGSACLSLSKALEGLNNALIMDSYDGFRKSQSCRPQLALLVHEIQAALYKIKLSISQFKIFLDAIQQHRQGIKTLSENRGTSESPDGWVHDSRVFHTAFIKTLKQMVNWLNTQYVMKDTL